MEENIEHAKMSKEEAIGLAKKALKDIGHWEDFRVENGRFLLADNFYDYNWWLVSFNFTENDWNNGEVPPIVIVNDKDKLVTFVSWKTSSFLLSYDKTKDKYFHSTLSR